MVCITPDAKMTLLCRLLIVFTMRLLALFVLDFLDSCRASTLLAELDDDEDLPEPDEEDDENEDDNQEDQEYEEVMVERLFHSLH
jgi:hypothetical protein